MHSKISLFWEMTSYCNVAQLHVQSMHLHSLPWWTLLCQSILPPRWIHLENARAENEKQTHDTTTDTHYVKHGGCLCITSGSAFFQGVVIHWLIMQLHASVHSLGDIIVQSCTHLLALFRHLQHLTAFSMQIWWIKEIVLDKEAYVTCNNVR